MTLTTLRRSICWQSCVRTTNNWRRTCALSNEHGDIASASLLENWIDGRAANVVSVQSQSPVRAQRPSSDLDLPFAARAAPII